MPNMPRRNGAKTVEGCEAGVNVTGTILQNHFTTDNIADLYHKLGKGAKLVST